VFIIIFLLKFANVGVLVNLWIWMGSSSKIWGMRKSLKVKNW